jgi:L-alanine-DL-glutamate epimerase-like enolase superfamily enzyme
MLPRLWPYGLAWLEEPLRTGSSLADWQQSCSHAGMPLAAGENLMGETRFAQVVNGCITLDDTPGIGVKPDLAELNSACA